MKKLYYAALMYMILGLLGGFFYRTYTQMVHFDGSTMLSLVHTHLLTLGMLFFLILMGLEKQFRFMTTKWGRLFFWHYNGGLLLTVGMMIVHGVMQVQNIQAGAAVAGIAGLGHMLLTVGLAFLFAALKPAVVKK
jgi:hypothetical protein